MSTIDLTRPAARRWLELIRAQQASGQPLKAFAAAHDVNAGTLKWWRSRLRAAGLLSPGAAPLVRFVPVEVQAVAVPARPLQLRFEALGVSAEVTGETDLTLLRRVAEALC